MQMQGGERRSALAPQNSLPDGGAHGAGMGSSVAPAGRLLTGAASPLLAASRALAWKFASDSAADWELLSCCLSAVSWSFMHCGLAFYLSLSLLCWMMFLQTLQWRSIALISLSLRA